ncbi:MAG: polyvinylalcohol dehydrogenase, partial [Pirellulales bacterium]
SEEVYFVPGSKIQNHHGGMILLGNHIYMGNKHNNGFPLCIEMLSGEVAWEPGRGPGGGSAAIIYADGHLYFRYEDGTMALIEASPEEYRLKGHFKLAEVRGKSWPHPVIVGGKLYLRDQDVLMCYDVSR